MRLPLKAIDIQGLLRRPDCRLRHLGGCRYYTALAGKYPASQTRAEHASGFMPGIPQAIRGQFRSSHHRSYRRADSSCT